MRPIRLHVHAHSQPKTTISIMIRPKTSSTYPQSFQMTVTEKKIIQYFVIYVTTVIKILVILLNLWISKQIRRWITLGNCLFELELNAPLTKIQSYSDCTSIRQVKELLYWNFLRKHLTWAPDLAKISAVNGPTIQPRIEARPATPKN